MEWIKCSDKLPKKDQMVIGWRSRTKTYVFARFCEDCWWGNNTVISLRAITHWQPLSEPPKEK